MFLPITLSTASMLVLFYFVLVAAVGRSRVKHKVSIGDGGHDHLLMRMRTQANFVEYVPLMLVLMALLEGAGANRQVLAIGGILLILFRILHFLGMPRPAPNAFRAIGAAGTILMMVGAGIWGLVIVLTAGA
ncbi:MAG: MAPEG family protein [Rhodospirillaceae bacterium]|nr:MAPEG family protein [Rhodospirillaceae bacterium]